MDRITIDMRDVDKLDIRALAKPLRSRVNGSKPLHGLPLDAIKNTIFLSERFNPALKPLGEMARAHASPPAIMMLRPVKAPMRSAVTIGLGSTASAVAIYGVSFGNGIYVEILPLGELGMYYSYGGGVWADYSLSAGLQVTYVFGSASDFAGIDYGIGVDVGLPGTKLSLGGMLLFSPPPFRVMGVSFTLSAGVGTMPVSISLQVSNTVTHPLLNLAF